MSITLQTYTSEKRTLCSEPEAGLRFESDTRVTLERTTEDIAMARTYGGAQTRIHSLFNICIILQDEK